MQASVRVQKGEGGQIVLHSSFLPSSKFRSEIGRGILDMNANWDALFGGLEIALLLGQCSESIIMMQRAGQAKRAAPTGPRQRKG